MYRLHPLNHGENINFVKKFQRVDESERKNRAQQVKSLISGKVVFEFELMLFNDAAPQHKRSVTWRTSLTL